MKIETLRWTNSKLEMIDQRILPASFKYLVYDSAASVAEGIRSMVVRGAPAILVAAAYGVSLEALRMSRQSKSTSSLKLTSQVEGCGNDEFKAGMEAGFTVLAQSRPTAVNLFWALKRMRVVWDSVKEQNNIAVAQRLLVEAHEVFAEDIRINQAMGTFGAELLPDGARVLTHCNACLLYTSDAADE